MNISIPDELRQRMQPLDSRLNWSGLAASAFKTAVDNAEYVASIKSAMKRRIVQTEIEDVGGVEAFAHRRGQEWAANNARMIELRQLERYVERQGVVDFGSWETVVRVLLGNRFDDYREEWFGNRSQFGSDVVESYEENYANAFVEGALEMLEELDRSE
jgi:hypothetical protein